MTRLDRDLGQIEKQVLAWARAPLSRTAPLEDLEGRIQSHKVGGRGCWDEGGPLLGVGKLSWLWVWEWP